MRRRLLSKSDGFCGIIRQHWHHMPQDVGAAAFRYMKDALVSQNALGQLYRRRQPPLLLFCVTLKSHLIWHVGFSCQYFSPRCGWCYRDSFVGRVAEVANSVVAGLGPLKIEVALATKW